MVSKVQLWYTRRGAIVQGPYPRGLIVRYVILGRIVADDELSEDGMNWVPLSALPELVPVLLRDEEAVAHRLDAARRWENERESKDRRREAAAVADERRSGQERRSGAHEARGAALRHEDFAAHLGRRRRLRRMAATIALAMLGALSATLAFYQPAPLPASPDCRQGPRPGINWNNCAMDGRSLALSDLAGAHMSNMSLSGAELGASRLSNADLSFANLSLAGLRRADLSQARLMGASLRGADLSEARFDDADLSYADLQGAVLAGASLRGARLDSAVWVDGTLCGPGSLGECRPAPARRPIE